MGAMTGESDLDLHSVVRRVALVVLVEPPGLFQSSRLHNNNGGYIPDQCGF